MQLGPLATVAMLHQRNLTIVVWDNHAYRITGPQPTATGSGADLVTIARGAGITRHAWATDERHFEQLVDEALAHDGPSLIAARIDGEPGRGATDRDPAQIRERFMRGLGVRQ